MKNLVDTALSIATKAHEGQKDKAGMPYINHPLHVASMMESEDEKAVALLHDVIEDTYYTKDMLLIEGIPMHIVDAVEALTHAGDTDYFEYLKTVKKNPLALSVKIQDLIHNSDLSRIEHPSPKDFKRLEKYKKALEFLSKK